MNNIRSATDYAWMSQASYLDLSNVKKGDDILKEALKKNTYARDKKFYEAQAKYFVEHYDFVHQQPNTAAGFSATTFKDKNSDSYTIAVRGTELKGMADIWEDIHGVVLSGKAQVQALEAFRYYKQLTTAAGEKVEYTDAEKAMLQKFLGSGISVDLPGQDGGSDTVVLIYESLVKEFEQDIGLGKITEPNATVNFAGHSLGGHLAYLLAEMVHTSGNAHPVGDVMTYNAPGLYSLPVELINLIIPGTIHVQSTDIAKKHLAFFGEAGIEVTALTGITFGTPVSVFIEDGKGIFENHAITRLSESLAVYNLLAEIDQDSQDKSAIEIIKKFVPVFQFYSSLPTAETLEKIIYTIDKIYKGDEAAKVSVDDQDGFYKKLQELKDCCHGNAKMDFDVKNFAVHAAESSAQSISYRYALANLNPFAITGADYNQHNTEGELNLFDAQNHPNGMTNEYIHSRGIFLTEMNRVKTEPTGTGIIYMKDMASGFMIDNPPNAGPGHTTAPDNRQRRIFGTESDDPTGLEGDKNDDFIFGGAGDDTLDGKGGDDYLEGGKGKDTYIIDGNDTVFDCDMQGKLVIGGSDETLNLHSTDSIHWFGSSAGKAVSAQRIGNDLQIDAGNDRVTVKEFFSLNKPTDDTVTGLNIRLNVIDEAIDTQNLFSGNPDRPNHFYTRGYCLRQRRRRGACCSGRRR